MTDEERIVSPHPRGESEDHETGSDHGELPEEANDECEHVGPKHRLFDMSALVRARSSASDDTRAVIDQIRSRGSMRALAQVPEGYAEACADLASAFPNFLEFINDHLVPQLALSRLSAQRQFGLTPLLLLGPPGIGKTSFCQALGVALSLPFHRINLESAQAGFEITGVARGWNSAGPGRLMRWLAADISVNGLFVMEELDKAGGDPRYDPKAPLLQLLEEITVRTFCDLSMPEVEFDVSPVSFVFTANTLEGLSAPLLDRLTVFEIPAMTSDQAREVARRQYASLLENFTLPGEPPTLTEEALDSLCVESPRRQRKLLQLALARAIARSSSSLSIRSTQTMSRRRLGFI
ncbi:AAA family ATPase [Ramlibacter sp. 2FC]|uniref:AAA family ATPase n=1 Tax=Ramlibacter sp. 2FC TaxID=2502188 RepID=UPI001485C22F|nr:AAA family ATPase [Ramlibacter sp. 2FC]